MLPAADLEEVVFDQKYSTRYYATVIMVIIISFLPLGAIGRL